jgi:hypothetical protein
MRLITLLCSLFLLLNLATFSQVKNIKVVELTGVVVTAGNLHSIPFVHVFVKKSINGSISDYYGFFSLIAHKNDTIVFSSLGYRTNEFVISDSLSKSNYSMIHLMEKDTFILDEVVIYQWPTNEQFKHAFLTLKLPDVDSKRAKENLDPKVIMTAATHLPIDRSTTYKYELQNRYTQLYEAEGYLSARVFDPVAWHQFIQLWGNGVFKKKDKINYLPKE